MEALWPQVRDEYLTFIKRLYTSPRHLDAAFDSEHDAQALILSGFPDMNPEEVADSVAAMMQWKDDCKHDFKRARRDIAFAVFQHPANAPTISVQDAYKTVRQTDPLLLIELHSKRKQKLYKSEADSRASRVDRERKKYTKLLAQVIIDAGLPVVALISTLDDPEQGWIHLFGSRRCNTLKNRYKSWAPFAVWLELKRGRKFPEGIRDIIDYIQFRVDEGCGKTVPTSFHVVLTLLEQLGRVPEPERLSSEELWKSHIKAWSAELAAEAPPAKPAEMFTCAILIALEITVVDEEVILYRRALAWVVLIMVWGALRCDDVQGLIPHRSILSNYGLRMILGRSKTSGPDKVQKELSVHIYRNVSLTGEDWLGIGFGIWDSEPFSFKRDFLVMMPANNWDGPVRKFATPSALSALISYLLSTLGTPKRTLTGWTVVDSCLLLPDSLESHFSGHSPRNFMTSVAAAIGFHKDERAYLGRWSMGMVASEEYVRTSRQVVFKIQKSVNRALVEGRESEYFEDEAIDRLCKTAEDMGANPNRIKKRHTVMTNLNGRNCLGGLYPTLDVREDDWFLVDGNVDDEPQLRVKIQEQIDAEKNAVEQTSKYFVTISRRTSFRRLHLVGCFVKPSNCMEVRLLNEVTEEDFDSICRSCKKKMLRDGGKDDLAESSSTASSSSTDSGKDDNQEFGEAH